MPKYINADEYKKKLRKRQKAGTISRNVLIIEFRAINEMPTADVVEVIRCKDCIWWHKFSNSLFGYCFARRYNDYAESLDAGIYRYYSRKCKGDFFCADGERKETE